MLFVRDIHVEVVAKRLLVGSWYLKRCSPVLRDI